uniref:TIR domain-containing adapter molecule 1 n=1 Tax=Scatophagus argus TaxID=75038 RepID=UPI001ED80A36|nr:TIR domain-containing adapter molecule 1 [Scatophagus argus]
MSHGVQENQGTGLRDVFDALLKAPPERLLSLTFQLSESPEDNIIHALCLIVLQKEAQAMKKLQMLGDNHLAKHLAEKWQTSEGKPEDFGIHCGNFQEFTQESLALLARIFKVLSEQRLCDPLLRNLAYQRAISSDDQKTSSCEDLWYGQLREEAKAVCGPQFEEWMCSTMDLKPGSYCDLHRSLEEGSKVTLSQDESDRAHSLPSPLQASSSVLSYPTHLEISVPSTASFHDDRKRTPEISGERKLNSPTVLVSEFGTENACGQSQTMSIAQKQSRMDETFAAENSKLNSRTTPTQTTNLTNEPNLVLPITTNFVPKMPVANKMHESSNAEEEEEEEEETIFYAFVILHAPEDAEMADSMREKLEKVIDGKGATFSEDFATPGKSSLKCVEDAINNTAFTLLLLTRNFNTRMQDLETNSALINSINKKHKYNTVIPLLPQENCMPKESMPLVLKTIIPLEENKNFERKIRKSMSPANIKMQRKIWIEEQTVKKQIERQERLKRFNQQQNQLIKECEATQLLERENLRLLMRQKLLLCSSVSPEQDGGDRNWWQQQPNIHINNAKYIMIGNDSQMTVDMGGGVDKDNSVSRDEEQ